MCRARSSHRLAGMGTLRVWPFFGAFSEVAAKFDVNIIWLAMTGDDCIDCFAQFGECTHDDGISNGGHHHFNRCEAVYWRG